MKRVQKNNTVTDIYECPVCGYSAENKAELREHFEMKSDDEEHQEYAMRPNREFINEDSVGTPAGTPGHPGFDEG